MPTGPLLTLLLEDAADLAPDRLRDARERDAARLGASARAFAFAPLDARSRGPAFVSVLEHEAPLERPAFSELGTTIVGVGTYRFRSDVAGSGGPIEAKGMLLGLTDCGDPARLDEFHRWYDESHAADVLRSGLYGRGRRFERVDGALGDYLAVYETAGTEPETFRSYLAWPERDRSRCEVFVVRQVLALRRL